MSRQRRVRNIQARTIGWRGHWWEEKQWPAWVYYPARGALSTAKRRKVSGALIAIFVLWVVLGTTGLLLLGVLSAMVLTVWLRWKGADEVRAPSGRKLSVEDMKHRRTLQRQWGLACRRAKLLGPESGEPPALNRLRSLGSGTFEATVECGKIGIPVADVQKMADVLAAVITCRELIVTPVNLSVCTLSFHWRDAIGRTLPLADLPVAGDGQLAYGIRQDGSVATIRATQSVLIGGMTRRGKSTLAWSLLADAIRQGMPVDLYVSDPKGGVELDQLEAAVGRENSLLRVREYAKTPQETVKMLTAAEKSMGARQYWMKQNGVRKISPDRVNPLVVVILDETLPLTDLLKKGTDSSLGRIAYTGAAAGHVVWANTQVAQMDAIGRFRDLIPQRICFATPNRQVTDSVLGDGSETMGAACSDIREPGVGYSHVEGDKLARRFRAAMVTDAETRLISEGRLPTDVVNKAREAYDRQAEGGAGKARGDRETFLYRWFYDEDGAEFEKGTLAYVGISYDVLQREAEHSTGLRAFMQGTMRRETARYPNRAAALAAEKLAIETEKPVWNVQHNGLNARRRLDRFKRDKAA